jgi:hypothetical protein
VAVKKKSKRIQEIKALVDPKESAKLARAAENALIDLEEKVQARYDYANEILEAQDTETVNAVEHMVESMRRMAGPPIFRFGGVAFDNESNRMEAIQMKNFYWVAIRLMVACIEWDIQIANFTPPKKKCMRCG